MLPETPPGDASGTGMRSSRPIGRCGRSSTGAFASGERLSAVFPARSIRLCCQALFLLLILSLAGAAAVDRVSVVDQGWRVVDRSGARRVQLRALVVNYGESPLRYQVQFLAEQGEPGSAGGSGAQVTGPSPAESETWVTVKTIAGASSSLPPGTSASVEGDLPYDDLTPGRPYRFRAKVVDPETGVELANARIAIPGESSAAGAGVVAFAAMLLGSDTESRVAARGMGVMRGQHEAQRVNGEWVESGSGTIEMGTTEGHLHLEYAYTARGASAATLTATATATGTLMQRSGSPARVEITSASARMCFPGFRLESQQTVSRSGASATGTFEGTVGGAEWNGILSLRHGTYTLDLDTGRGEHSFQVQLIRAVPGTAPVQAASDREIAAQR